MACNHEKGLCCVSHKDRLVFIGVPTNASTSIRNALNMQGYSDNYLSILDSNSREKNYTTFAVRRDPVERLISGYIKVCARATGDCPHILQKRFYWERNQKTRFYVFIDELEESFFDCHVEQQAFFLTDYDNNLLKIDYFLKMEQLNVDFSNMCQQLGLEYSLDHLNKANIESPTSRIIIKALKYIFKVVFNLQSLRKPYSLIILRFIYRVKLHMKTRPLPSKIEIRQLIQEDSTLQQRIHNLYKDDFELYKKGISTS